MRSVRHLMDGETSSPDFDGGLSAYRLGRKARLTSDPLMPNVLSFLKAADLRAIGDALGGIDARRLVDMRYDLAHAFVQHLGSMRGDQYRPDRFERRKALRKLEKMAAGLRCEFESNLPMLPEEHYAAHFFGAEGTGPSNFSSDYTLLMDAVARIEQIAKTILSAPPIGGGSTTSRYVVGFPSERQDNPGTWRKIAFARRIAQLYRDYTGKSPGVSSGQPGPYQRMLALTSDMFKRSYDAIDRPFGRYTPPGLRDQKQACNSV